LRFDPPLVPGTLIQRYKRFLADVKLEDGSTITAHCPNTGSMLGCADPGSRVWLVHAPSPTRKYAWSWELTELPGGRHVGVNTHRSNALVREALENGRLPGLGAYTTIRPEAAYGQEGSRVDFLLSAGGLPDCYLEVKNVTAAVQDGVALFPDAVSARGTKHLREMMQVVAAGARAVLLFCVQRDDVTEVRPADAIDPLYGRTLREALGAGVEALALRARLDAQGIVLETQIPVRCP
jgi:sugar fermentation stimulation protein A